MLSVECLKLHRRPLQFQLNQDQMNFSTLRNIQGLFAPLKLQMEFKAVQQVSVGTGPCVAQVRVAVVGTPRLSRDS